MRHCIHRYDIGETAATRPAPNNPPSTPLHPCPPSPPESKAHPPTHPPTVVAQVSDNGSGIAPDQFAALTAKHHTSKLRDFSDLDAIASYGFRGEALSSLCAVATVTFVTRTEREETGTKLVYDHAGQLLKQEPIARQVAPPPPPRWLEGRRGLGRGGDG